MDDAPDKKQLTEDQVVWVINGHLRSIKLKRAGKMAFIVLIHTVNVLKWVAESLKWAVPLGLALLLAWERGLITALREFYQ